MKGADVVEDIGRSDESRRMLLRKSLEETGPAMTVVAYQTQ